jgi:uncharacterized protein (TIGR04255 family)
MPFPITPRVEYERNPLNAVVCQLRFPTVLRIETLPTGFQEAVRGAFPLFEEKNEPDLPRELAPLVAQHLGFKSIKNFHFTSADKDWTINLTREFIALTCRKYRRWEAFRDHLRLALDAFVKEYQPSFFTRVGLRYQDSIKPSSLGLQGRPWRELIAPHILGVLADRGVGDSTEAQVGECRIALVGDIGKVVIKHGVAMEADELVYVIDSDFFAEGQMGVEEAYGRLDEFKRRASRLFRWSITEVLHEAMRPRSVE